MIETEKNYLTNTRHILLDIDEETSPEEYREMIRRLRKATEDT